MSQVFLKNLPRTGIAQTKAVWPNFIDEVVAGFTETLLWQAPDESLHGSELPLSYGLQEKIQQTCMIFIALVYTDGQAALELVPDAGGNFSWAGHSLCLEWLGHGSGFFDYDSKESLSAIVSYMNDYKLMPQFQPWTGEEAKDSDGNQVIDWDIA